MKKMRKGEQEMKVSEKILELLSEYHSLVIKLHENTAVYTFRDGSKLKIVDCTTIEALPMVKISSIMKDDRLIPNPNLETYDEEAEEYYAARICCGEFSSDGGYYGFYIVEDVDEDYVYVRDNERTLVALDEESINIYFTVEKDVYNPPSLS
jgi:hypothetical protein